MPSLLNNFASALGPAVTDTLSAQLGLDPKQANDAIPAVAQPLLDGLRQKLEAPEQNVKLLTTLYQFLTDTDKPVDPSAASAASANSTTATLVEQLTGRDLGGFAQQVGNRLGLESSTAQSLVLFVAPKLFAFLRGKTQSQGFDTLLQSMLGGSGGTKAAAILKLVQGAGDIESTLKGLGGLFGK